MKKEVGTGGKICEGSVDKFEIVIKENGEMGRQREQSIQQC